MAHCWIFRVRYPYEAIKAFSCDWHQIALSCGLLTCLRLDHLRQHPLAASIHPRTDGSTSEAWYHLSANLKRRLASQLINSIYKRTLVSRHSLLSSTTSSSSFIMSSGVCFTSAIELKDPNHVRLQIQTAFDNCLRELRQAQAKFYGRSWSNWCQLIIKVLESCKSSFTEKWPQTKAEQISPSNGISADDTLNNYFTVHEGSRIELATLGDAKAVHSAVEKCIAISHRPLNCDAAMQKICEFTLDLAQTTFSKDYVKQEHIASLKRLQKNA